MTAATEPAERGEAFRLAVPAAVAAMLFLALAMLSVPRALGRWFLSPDSIEHAAVAHNLAWGKGLVDPVLYNYAFEGSPPVPAAAYRAPVLPALLSVPFALGATVAGVQAAHACFAAAVVAAIFLVGLRFMSLAAALAAAALIGFAPIWLMLSERLWAEAAGVAGYMLVLLTVRGVTRSVPAAFLCSAATVFAWLSRPNLAPVYLAVIVGGVFVLGAGRAVRSKPLWAYAAFVVVLYVGVQMVAEIVSGTRVYEGYSGTLTRLDTKAASHYYRSSSAVMDFIVEHAAEIGDRIVVRCWGLFHALFRGHLYDGLGWWLPVGVVAFCARARQRRAVAIEVVVNVLCAVGFGVMVILNYADFDQFRYPLMCAVAAVLSGVALSEDIVGRFADSKFPVLRQRFARSWSWLRIAPLLLAVAAIVAPSIATSAAEAKDAWQSYRAEGTLKHSFGKVLDAPIQRLCSVTEPDAVIAGEPPLAWLITFWCGNPTLSLPRDVKRPAQWAQFRDERQPDYLVLKSRRGRRMIGYPGLRGRPDLDDGIVVYDVVPATRESPRWMPPVPVSCAGETECSTRPRRAG